MSRKKKGDPKTPGSGRTKGTPNKKTEEFHAAVAAQMDASGSDDPVEVMQAIMMAPMPKVEDYENEAVAYVMAMKSWAALRFEAAKNLAPYKHPKLSSVDLKVNESSEHIAAVNERMMAEQPDEEEGNSDGE